MQWGGSISLLLLRHQHCILFGTSSFFLQHFPLCTDRAAALRFTSFRRQTLHTEILGKHGQKGTQSMNTLGRLSPSALRGGEPSMPRPVSSGRETDVKMSVQLKMVTNHETALLRGEESSPCPVRIPLLSWSSERCSQKAPFVVSGSQHSTSCFIICAFATELC